jgi:hypothetical protein
MIYIYNYVMVLFAAFMLSNMGLAQANEGKSAFGIYSVSSFEKGEKLIWKGSRNTGIKVIDSGGALASDGYLQVGPSDYKWVGAILNSSFIAGKDTWAGFSLRIKDGGIVKLQIGDVTKKKNVSKKFKLPPDGTWKTFKVQLAWLTVNRGDKLRRFSFYAGNGDREKVSFDIDNVVIASGAPKQNMSEVKLELSPVNGNVRLDWKAPESKLGVHYYHVYRGVSSNFKRDKKHLLATTDKPFLIDNVFVHEGKYYYAVKAVDFVGNKSKGSKAVMIDTNKF